MAPKKDGPEWVPMYLVTLVLVAFLLVVGAAGHDSEAPVRTPQVPQIEPPSRIERKPIDIVTVVDDLLLAGQ